MYLMCTSTVGGTLGFSTGINETFVETGLKKEMNYIDNGMRTVKYAAVGTVIGPITPIVLIVGNDILKNIKPNN